MNDKIDKILENKNKIKIKKKVMIKEERIRHQFE